MYNLHSRNGKLRDGPPTLIIMQWGGKGLSPLEAQIRHIDKGGDNKCYTPICFYNSNFYFLSPTKKKKKTLL